MHWHGFEIPNDVGGGPGVSEVPIKPGGRFVYEFILHQAGTYFSSRRQRCNHATKTNDGKLIAHTVRVGVAKAAAKSH